MKMKSKAFTHRFWRVLFFCLFLFSSGKIQAQQVLTLKECVDIALQSNPDLAAAQQLVNKAKADYKASYSDFFPKLSATAGYNAANSAIIGAGSVQSTSNQGTQQQLSVGPQLDQNIFAGYKNVGALQKSRSDLQAAEANLALVKTQVSYNLRVAFANLLYNQKLLSLNQNIATRRQQNQKMIELRFLVGRENKGTSLRSEAQSKQAEFEVSKTQQNLKVAMAQLAKALGKNELSEVSIKGEFQFHKAENTPNFEEISQHVPSYLQAKAQADSSKSSVKIARSGILPSVDAVANFAYIRNDWQTDISRWTAGVNLSYPLSGRNYYEMKSAQAEQHYNMQVLQSTQQANILSLKKTYSDYVTALQAIDVQKKLVEAAEVREEIAKSQYNNGLLSYQDWDLIENDLISNQQNLLLSYNTLMIAEAAWEQAQGKGIIP